MGVVFVDDHDFDSDDSVYDSLANAQLDTDDDAVNNA